MTIYQANPVILIMCMPKLKSMLYVINFIENCHLLQWHLQLLAGNAALFQEFQRFGGAGDWGRFHRFH